MATRIGGTLKKLMHARIMASGGDFAARVAFAEEDFAAAATDSITRRQCLDWTRHMYESHPSADDCKLYLLMNELSDDEVRNVCSREKCGMQRAPCEKSVKCHEPHAREKLGYPRAHRLDA